MPVQGPTADTYGLMCPSTGQRINFRGLPSGHPAAADPDNMVTLPVAPLYGPAGEPLAQPSHLYAESTISLELERVPAWQFEDYSDFVEAIARAYDARVKYSPLGSTNYPADLWALVSTTEGWTETEHGYWSGPLELWRRGTA